MPTFWQKGYSMVCKNCGARLKDNAKRCSNCGAVVESNHIDINRYADYGEHSDSPSRHRAKMVFGIIIAIIVAIALGVGSYMFFDYQHANKSAPELSFKTGTGIANDKKMIYLTIDDSSKIAYIHGVKLYDGDVTKPALKKADPISTDYQYTKNQEDSFRAIFFYADDLGVKKGSDYTYTFEMTFGFAEDTNVYTYNKVISFNGDINEDATKVIFDYSYKEELPSTIATTTTTTQASNEQTTAPDSTDISYIYNSFWFTSPYSNGDNHYISCWKFNQNQTISVTNYSYENKAWKTTSATIKYTVSGNTLTVDDGESESATYQLNPKELSIKELTDNNSVATTLTSRKYNSLSNVEDFFGM